MRIGIVNDLAMAIESLRRIVSTVPDYKIIWIAENGAEAVKLCEKETPDLILMDLVMPVMNGVEATKRIMKSTPCAILIVTASVGLNSGLVFEAMGVGALDAVTTPALDEPGKKLPGKELLDKIARIGKLIGVHKKTPKHITIPKHKIKNPTEEGLIVIGCSTGGPQALMRILSDMPANNDVSIIVIQHMDEQFTPDMITWLHNKTKKNVELIKDGDHPKPGTVLFPCTQKHAILTPENRIVYIDGPEDNFYHPSVDIFFQSVAMNWNGHCIGVLLTGMGRDGAEGLLALKKRGWLTIAQDKDTSVVYGMPKAAAELRAAKMILPLDCIGGAIAESLKTF